MRQILAADYDQIHLLPPCVEDWVGPEHPARFVREFVAALDLKALGLDTLKREEGGLSYEPALLLSVWLYGYLRRVRSTRAVERACREEMGFVWLSGNHRPDHNALWRFWDAHREGLRTLFRQSVKVAFQLDLLGLAVQALDGTKIMAACRGRGGCDEKDLAELLAQLDTELTEREAEIARAGAAASAAGLPVGLHRAQTLRTKVRDALDRVRSGQTKHAHPLEPDAARMECDGRNRFGYNAQALVDAKAQVIVAAALTNAPTDTAQLTPLLAQATALRAEIGAQAQPATVADGGYASGAQLAAAAEAGHEVLTPLPSASKDDSHPYHSAHFRHDPQRRIVVCPQGRELPLLRVREHRGHQIEVYRSAKVCKDCPVRSLCTTSRHGRSIDLGPGHAHLEALRARWKKPGTAEYYELRAATVEPVFAQVKQQMGFRRWTVRGLEKAGIQWAMLCTTWNLQVIYRRWRGPNSSPSGPVPPQNAPRADRALAAVPACRAFPQESFLPLLHLSPTA
ncbi:MAG TPA: IS1182 family transposase [Lacunisphaera sp.]|nr:IS1182 family transposase [Lacunisphaera sp.]